MTARSAGSCVGAPRVAADSPPPPPPPLSPPTSAWWRRVTAVVVGAAVSHRGRCSAGRPGLGALPRPASSRRRARASAERSTLLASRASRWTGVLWGRGQPAAAAAAQTKSMAAPLPLSLRVEVTSDADRRGSSAASLSQRSCRRSASRRRSERHSTAMQSPTAPSRPVRALPPRRTAVQLRRNSLAARAAIEAELCCSVPQIRRWTLAAPPPDVFRPSPPLPLPPTQQPPPPVASQPPQRGDTPTRLCATEPAVTSDPSLPGTLRRPQTGEASIAAPHRAPSRCANASRPTLPQRAWRRMRR